MIPKQFHAKHPEAMSGLYSDEDFKNLGVNQDTYSLCIDFFPDLKSSSSLIIYAGLVTGPTGKHILTIDSNIITEYIRKNYVSGMKVIFDNCCEGNLDVHLDKIYTIISNLEINSDDIYYVCGAIDIEPLYENFCKKNNIQNRIHIFSSNTWEFLSKESSKLNAEPEYHIKEKSKLFLCFNRMVRIHRICLFSLFSEINFIDKSFYSFFPEATYGNLGKQQTETFLGYLSGIVSKSFSEKIINEYRKQEEHLPLKLNIDWTTNKTFIDSSDIQYFEQSYLSLVTETFFFSYHYNGNLDGHSIFFTEKTFKPISMKHPFILASRPYSLKYLKSLGYKTFHPFINENYDTIENNEKRLIAIVEEIKRLNNFSIDDWIEWQANIKPIVEHNFNIFNNKKDYIVKRI